MRRRREVVRKWMERNEGEVVRRFERKEDGDGRKTGNEVDDNITGKRREVMRWRIERNEGWRGGEDDWEEGGSEDDRKEGER